MLAGSMNPPTYYEGQAKIANNEKDSYNSILHQFQTHQSSKHSLKTGMLAHLSCLLALLNY